MIVHNNTLLDILSELKTSKGKSLSELESSCLSIDYSCLDFCETDSFAILDSIFVLIDWKLVDAYIENKLLKSEDIRKDISLIDKIVFYISKQTLDIEGTFEVNLCAPARSIFEKSRISSNFLPRVFVLMPFTSKLKPVYQDHISKVVKKKKISIGRADDFFSNGSIISDIWSAIRNASIVIADCTGRNPNVFYEIGIAHALSKETILITQNIKDIPFDLRHLRIIVYEFTPKGMYEFEGKLSRTINAILKE